MEGNILQSGLEEMLWKLEYVVESGIEVDQKVQKSMTWVGWGAVSGSLLEPPLRSYYTST